ncbi:MAG: ABC transporter substrate-binding protein [Clostridiaceae bacterium]
MAGAATNPRIDDIKKNGKLVIATANYKPFGYFDEKTKEIVGYDIDIAQKIADKLGVPLKVKSMESSELMPAIMNGEADLAISDLYIPLGNKKAVDYSDPYLKSAQIIVTDKNSSINTSKDLAGKKVGVKYGESGVAAVQDLIDKGENIQLVAYNSNEEMLADVESGKLDAGVNDLLYQLQYNSTHPSLKIHDEVLREEQLGIVVRKGDTNLLKVIN